MIWFTAIAVLISCASLVISWFAFKRTDVDRTAHLRFNFPLGSESFDPRQIVLAEITNDGPATAHSLELTVAALGGGRAVQPMRYSDLGPGKKELVTWTNKWAHPIGERHVLEVRWSDGRGKTEIRYFTFSGTWQAADKHAPYRTNLGWQAEFSCMRDGPF